MYFYNQIVKSCQVTQDIQIGYIHQGKNDSGIKLMKLTLFGYQH